MLRFIKNDKGIMGLTLSQIGLIIAAGILITAVFSLVFQNNWQKEAELKNIASSFSTIIKGMDSKFFENTTVFHFSEKNYEYFVNISTEYVIVTSGSSTNDELSIKERFLVRPWPKSKNMSWRNGIELHEYLNANFNNSGNISDPIQNVSEVKNYLGNEREIANKYFALNPLYIHINKVVHLDKIYVYYDSNGDGMWDKDDEKQDFILIYQC